MALVKKNVREIAGEARFSREMAAARGLIGDPAQARRDSPDPGRRHDGRGHLAAIFRRRASDSIDAPRPLNGSRLFQPGLKGPKTARLTLLVQKLTRSA